MKKKDQVSLEGITFTGIVPQENIDELHRMMLSSVFTPKEWKVTFEGDFDKYKKAIVETMSIKELMVAIYRKQIKWLTRRFRLTRG